MQEKVLKNRKNGMPVLLLLILLYLAALAGFIASGIQAEESASPLFTFLTILCVVWMLFGWILFFGLKVLRPQEALVLTLFGKYVGTLREEGFYFVNPFCSSVNPA
ncbi:MAG: SPFH domain-containing protein, partial [Clostridiales bacterium]|nr:SPFH domain-containing protein [Clostridiales bacterium]